MGYVNFNEIYKKYPKADDYSVENFNLEIKQGEFIVFVGPSGCGKSTTLRMIAGLEEITGGTIEIDGQVINDVHPKDRDIAMVFQNYALYPHMTVYNNIVFGLKNRKTPKDEMDKKANWAAGILGLEEYLDRKPKDLSGGQRQRVALARAIVRNPKVFLMDEPLSNLDAKLRSSTRNEITKLHRELDATTIYVTHDQVEAMTMADRIVVMKDGLIQQVGTPIELYAKPKNLFVAGFIGSPQMNFINANIKEDGTLILDSSDGDSQSTQVIELPEGVIKKLDGHVGEVVLGIRPEHVSINQIEIDSFPSQVVKSTISNLERMGNSNHVFTKLGADDIILTLPSRMTEVIGDVVTYRLDINKAHFFDPSTKEAISHGDE